MVKFGLSAKGLKETETTLDAITTLNPRLHIIKCNAFVVECQLICRDHSRNRIVKAVNPITLLYSKSPEEAEKAEMKRLVENK
jgi:hypothetical protein